MPPTHKTYHDPQKWDNICQNLKAYYQNKTKFKLNSNQKSFFLFTEEPQVTNVVCCQNRISSPVFMGPIQEYRNDNHKLDKGHLGLTTSNCLRVPQEKKGHLSISLHMEKAGDSEVQVDPVILAIWEAGK